MDKVIKKLNYLASEIDLTQRFDFVVDPYDSIFTKQEREELCSLKSQYEKNVRLKWQLSEKYKLNPNSTILDFWIINTWGGIRSFKATDKNKKKIKTFKKQLEKQRLSKDSFSTISSLSKISSFMFPEEFVIYDSRVIYALNWLILTCENNFKLKEKYYPMPNGRNKILTDFDMNTILNLSHTKEYENATSIFISQQEAYFRYCDFIKSSTNEVFDRESQPYELEMLLFTIADKEIFHEIKEKSNLSTH